MPSGLEKLDDQLFADWARPRYGSARASVAQTWLDRPAGAGQTDVGGQRTVRP